LWANEIKMMEKNKKVINYSDKEFKQERPIYYNGLLVNQVDWESLDADGKVPMIRIKQKNGKWIKVDVTELYNLLPLQTVLPAAITTVDEAKTFLQQLFNNGESYHCEDDANDCLRGIVTKEQGNLLNKLMADCFKLKDFDPCAFLLDINPEYLPNLEDLTVNEVKEYLSKYSDEKIKNWIIKSEFNCNLTTEQLHTVLLSIHERVFI
jgi:hypothetical protein